MKTAEIFHEEVTMLCNEQRHKDKSWEVADRRKEYNGIGRKLKIWKML